MDVLELIDLLDEAGIVAEVVGGRLRVSPRERLTTALLQALTELENEMVAMLVRVRVTKCLVAGCGKQLVLVDGHGFVGVVE